MREFVFVLLFLPIIVFSQDSFTFEKTDSLTIISELDSLRANFAQNKKIEADYELVILKALSFYPELTPARISFKSAKIGTTMNARPAFGSLVFRSKQKRKYVIRMNNQDKDSIIVLKHVPFDAKIGVVGHELAHILDYHHRSFWGVISRGLSYVSKSKKAAFEKEIDLLTIQRGLGYELYSWSKYVLNESPAATKYKSFKAATYLTPEEILYYMNQSSSNNKN
jgi:hypothetical protein